jgi:hypothetical protein
LPVFSDKITMLWDFFRIFVRRNKPQHMKRLIISLIALITMQSILAADRLSSLPCPILGGELSNSAATSVADIDEVMPRMLALGLNTVLVPAYWELMEPVEG